MKNINLNSTLKVYIRNNSSAFSGKEGVVTRISIGPLGVMYEVTFTRPFYGLKSSLFLETEITKGDS